ncbi:P22 phage major capsid protein family protein [Gryllotalpicola koreensis]|uniref:P22 coat protein-protein 5 domain protein n=1 Tax=Gryllotalpicola koreensis TaxID=993086 RepID=A0ABP8A2W7_9MICO
MANTFLTPQVIAQAALATLYETTVAAQLVHRDYSPEFVAKVGDTVNVRKPAVFEAQEFADGGSIDLQDATEGNVPVVLNHHADVSFSVTTKDLSLKIEDFAAQLLDPAMEAISQKIDRDVLSFRNDITAEVGSGTGDYTSLYTAADSLVDAGTVLDIANVPVTERRVIVGPKTKGAWLKDPLLQRADQSGSTAALRQANFGGFLFGFDPYMSQNIGQPAANPAAGQPTTEVNVGFHRTAVALVTRQLELPLGAQNAAIEGYKGFGIRVVYDYDIKSKKDIVSLDVLYGVKTLDPARAVLIKGADKAA